MTDADYELWAAMMADDEEVAAKVAPVVVPEPVQIIAQAPPTPLVEQPQFLPPAQVQAEVVEVSPYEDETHVFIPFEQVVLAEPPVVAPDPEVGLPEFIPSVDDLDEEDEVEFSASLFKEPQTNSITITEVPDALNADIVTESGEVLKTGAIDMPILNNTGSIPIITITPDEVDEDAIIADMGDETTGGIPPIRAGSVMNSSAKVGVLPIKNRRSEGQTVLLATTSILLVAIGAGLIAANWLGLL
ncbi:MAG: hypothetical protein RLY83_842 [Actinomycetota bacterium]|jgi:hypothetical protein